jgi:hypothetical protein
MVVLITIISSIVGGLGTFLLSQKLHWHAIKASAILSLIIATPFEIYNLNEYESIPFIVFGASFVGMSSQKLFNNKLIFFTSILFGIVYTLINSKYDQLGGTLGTTACLSCLSVVTINRLIKRN